MTPARAPAPANASRSPHPPPRSRPLRPPPPPGRILNVSVTAADTREPPRLLNYLTGAGARFSAEPACACMHPWALTSVSERPTGGGGGGGAPARHARARPTPTLALAHPPTLPAARPPVPPPTHTHRSPPRVGVVCGGLLLCLSLPLRPAAAAGQGRAGLRRGVCCAGGLGVCGRGVGVCVESGCVVGLLRS